MMYNKEHPLRVVTLCSGYDSQCLALKYLKDSHPDFEFDLVAWSEIDKSAITAHNILFPEYKDRNLGDMARIDWSKVPDFDFLTYSTPCQSVSTAGLRNGIAEGSGTRSSLLWYTRNAILAHHPKYLMMENVKGLVSHKFLPFFHKWLAELDSYGYNSFYKVLNAKDYGVPQNRERIFVISILRTEDEPNPEYHFPSPIKLETTVEDILEDNVSPEYFLSQPLLEKYLAKADINESIKRLYPEDSNTENG